MTKKQMSARIAELEAMVLTLSMAINAMRTPIYVAPVPAQPTVNPLPINPFPMPYIGDPPSWPGSGWTSAPNIGIGPLPNTAIGGTLQPGRAECRVYNTLEG